MKSCDDVRRRIALGDRPLSLDAERIEHLVDCAACRSDWIAAALLCETGLDAPTLNPCTRTAELGMLLGAAPAGGWPSALFEHVASCPTCTHELALVAQDVNGLEDVRLSAPPPALEEQARALLPGGRGARSTSASAAERPARDRLLGLAAAAGIALAALGLWLILLDRERPLPRTDSGRVLRGEEGLALNATTPSGELAGAEALHFEWTDPALDSPNGEGALYRLIVVDAGSGVSVLDVRTARSRYVPTAEEAGRLRPQARYHWLVESLREEGPAPSAPQLFWVAGP